jgi:ATP-dependent Clp protease adaptor protein ClpS
MRARSPLEDNGAMPTIAPDRVAEAGEDIRGEVGEDQDTDRVWVTVVWNDPVNLMSYVTYVFQKLFGYNREKAHALMLDVHYKGRAAVSSGSRDEMERDVTRLHAYGLWATVTQG